MLQRKKQYVFFIIIVCIYTLILPFKNNIVYASLDVIEKEKPGRDRDNPKRADLYKQIVKINIQNEDVMGHHTTESIIQNLPTSILDMYKEIGGKIEIISDSLIDHPSLNQVNIQQYKDIEGNRVSLADHYVYAKDGENPMILIKASNAYGENHMYDRNVYYEIGKAIARDVFKQTPKWMVDLVPAFNQIKGDEDGENLLFTDVLKSYNNRFDESFLKQHPDDVQEVFARAFGYYFEPHSRNTLETYAQEMFNYMKKMDETGFERYNQLVKKMMILNKMTVMQTYSDDAINQLIQKQRSGIRKIDDVLTYKLFSQGLEIKFVDFPIPSALNLTLPIHDKQSALNMLEMPYYYDKAANILYIRLEPKEHVSPVTYSTDNLLRGIGRVFYELHADSLIQSIKNSSIQNELNRFIEQDSFLQGLYKTEIDNNRYKIQTDTHTSKQFLIKKDDSNQYPIIQENQEKKVIIKEVTKDKEYILEEQAGTMYLVDPIVKSKIQDHFKKNQSAYFAEIFSRYFSKPEEAKVQQKEMYKLVKNTIDNYVTNSIAPDIQQLDTMILQKMQSLQTKRNENNLTEWEKNSIQFLKESMANIDLAVLSKVSSAKLVFTPNLIFTDNDRLSRVKGNFIYGTTLGRKITYQILPDVFKEDSSIVAIHEMGHLLANYMSERPTNKQVLIDIFNEEKLKNDKLFPDNYPYSHIEEFFAQTFAYYFMTTTTYPGTNQSYSEYLKEKSPNTYQFISDIVKEINNS
ncbi:hypothetical protein IIU_06718 [Bacillus cereus VD133]|uniref:ATLF-like domain-containing protein n=1 Tax=Bacillus cereus VD133 TaxID=1053233 RepID=A0A9W5UZ44_BACCE|nr:hypothetical protein [Bacillus cereus]EOO24496.1 hypothetical protein IIU_06718 [Bacillus cereus VD133]